MRLTLKLLAAIGLTVAAAFAGDAAFRLRTDQQNYESDVRRDHRLLAEAMVGGIEHLGVADDARIEAFVTAFSRPEPDLTVRWTSNRRAAAGAPGSVVTVGPRGERSLVTRASVVGRGTIEITEALRQREAFVRASTMRSIAFKVAMLTTLLILVTFLCIGLVGRPLRKLADQARRVGAGDLGARLHLSQRDEMRTLADEMNAMCERLSAAQARAHHESEQRVAALEQLRHADRLRTAGELASGIAHEIGTPLNVMRARAAMIASGEASGTRAAELGAIIVREADRVAATKELLLGFARREPPRAEHVDLARCAREVVDLVQPLADARQVSLDVGPGPASAEGDATLLSQVVANLLVNAIQATPAGGSVRVTVERDEGARGEARVVVTDTGRGIAPEHLPHLFEPFFTTKRKGEGSGLGLAVAGGIVREHGGFIEARSLIGEGSTFVVHLPHGGPA